MSGFARIVDRIVAIFIFTHFNYLSLLLVVEWIGIKGNKCGTLNNERIKAASGFRVACGGIDLAGENDGRFWLEYLKLQHIE
jgi:hypothetical protein